jgi:Fe2+ transport system protein FeoA
MVEPRPQNSGPIPPQRPPVVSLSEVCSNTEVIVSDIVDGHLRNRFMELGFVPGAQLQVLRAGDPTISTLNNCRIALSRRCLEPILVAFLETLRSPQPTRQVQSS